MEVLMRLGDKTCSTAKALRAWRRDRGYALVMLLAAVAIVGIGLSAAGTLWAEHNRREREAELIRVGALFATAIANYYATAPGSEKALPPTLDALLLDTRFFGTRRHLRRVYPDPIDPTRAWGVIRGPDGGIQGVYSQSLRRPLRTAPLQLGILDLPQAERYADWRFVPKGLP